MLPLVEYNAGNHALRLRRKSNTIISNSKIIFMYNTNKPQQKATTPNNSVVAHNPSKWCNFHFAFLGYSFQHTETKKIYSKLEMWYRNRLLCYAMTEKGMALGKYILVDSKHWVNGTRVENSSNHKYA